MRLIKEVRSELRKVNWMNKKDVFKQLLSIHVIGGVILLYFFGIDYVINFITG